MNYTGVIIEESLEDASLLADVHVVKTNVESVTPKHKTPWLTKWTLHTIEIPEEKAEELATKISNAFDHDHPHWYVDYILTLRSASSVAQAHFG